MKKQIEKFFIITIFLILLNILYAKSEKSDEICIQKTFELYNIVSQETIQFTDDNEYMRGMLVFSGKSINDLGDYHHCMKLKKADFFSVLVYTEKVGVCYFKECEVRTIQKYLPEIIKILETRIPIKLDPSYIFFFDIR